MIDMLKRHEIQVRRRAGHTWAVAVLSGVSIGTVRRVAAEAAVGTVNNAAERRRIGRPSKVDAYRDGRSSLAAVRSFRASGRARALAQTSPRSAAF
jgi:hypothetical protein